MNGGPQRRVSSPSGASTLITSAPRSASVCPAHGPARMRASSTTFNPASGVIASVRQLFVEDLCEILVRHVRILLPVDHEGGRRVDPVLRRNRLVRRD